MKIKVLRPGIFHVTCKTQYELCMTFIRMQEYYESTFKNIKGKVFSLETYMDTYASKMGNFTYTQDWTGFNIPGEVYTDFRYEFFALSDFSEKEKLLMYEIENLLMSKNVLNGKFYIIGTYKEVTINHEIAHALYYLNPEYKKEMRLLTKSFRTATPSLFTSVKNSLSNGGYANNVIEDEIQAYFSEADPKYFFNRYEVKVPLFLMDQYKKVFDKFN